ncbi:hypothetical protein EYF80_015766 [Liparis tanakae]|uniref:Uncharacterized protein n=1 Tax=Liparis tanakae TaxID=230148 RepID=A0A4Z2I7B8_9TELE|nr:hypothetical protein EYF80_015766 [Liparis tanakae]
MFCPETRKRVSPTGGTPLRSRGETQEMESNSFVIKVLECVWYFITVGSAERSLCSRRPHD